MLGKKDVLRSSSTKELKEYGTVVEGAGAGSLPVPYPGGAKKIKNMELMCDVYG
jgi:hypothetical protein